MRRGHDTSLLPLDPEIERTFRQARRNQRLAQNNPATMEDENNRGEGDQRRPPNVAREIVNEQEQRQLINPPPRQRALHEYTVPTLNGFQSSIQQPPIEANNFEIRAGLLTMLQNNGLFSGLAHEDPHLHLVNFLETCDSHKMNGVTPEALQLRLFKHSLQGAAREWLQTRAPHSISSWAQLAQLFMNTYNSPTKTERIRREIQNFIQEAGEALFETWERFKQLVRRCPNHGLQEWRQLQIFYDGLQDNSRTVLDSAAGGMFMSLTYDEAYELLERIARNKYMRASDRSNSGAVKTGGILELDGVTAITAQLEKQSKQVAALQTQQVHAVQVPDQRVDEMESINYVHETNRRQRNPYSNTYNPGWKDHPNFGWGGNQQGQRQAPPQGQPPNYSRPAPGFQNPPQAQPQGGDLANILAQFMTTTQASIRNLETQMGQLATQLTARPSRALPSNTEDPRKNNVEQCNAVSLRNGRQLEEAPRKEKQNTVIEKPNEIKEKEATRKEPPSPTVISRVPQVPYPQKLQKKKLDAEHQGFLNKLKEIHINIPFIEAIQKMPKWVKFLKELVTKRNKLQGNEIIQLTEQCSEILVRPLPQKLGDPGKFTIPCTIGGNNFRSLIDLGASINLMPYSIYKNLGLGEIEPTAITLQLADRSLVYPKGILENVLVKVNKFIFPVDFVILDIDEDREIPLILGRPFLATSKTLIDCASGDLSMTVHDKTIKFNVFSANKNPCDDNDCYAIDLVDFTNHDDFDVLILDHGKGSLSAGDGGGKDSRTEQVYCASSISTPPMDSQKSWDDNNDERARWMWSPNEPNEHYWGEGCNRQVTSVTLA
ncbi:hypothetical protein ABFS82_12G043800 [Erythranthe guttata]